MSVSRPRIYYCSFSGLLLVAHKFRTVNSRIWISSCFVSLLGNIYLSFTRNIWNLLGCNITYTFLVLDVGTYPVDFSKGSHLEYYSTRWDVLCLTTIHRLVFKIRLNKHHQIWDDEKTLKANSWNHGDSNCLSFDRSWIYFPVLSIVFLYLRCLFIL